MKIAIINMIELIFVFAVAAVVGYLYRDLEDNIKELWFRMTIIEEQVPKKKPGVTLGSYKHVDEVNPQPQPAKARGKVVTPKTPAKMDWDAEQELKEQNHKFNVGPK